jgi:kynureninase
MPDGAMVDLAPIAAASRDLGARLVIDGSQSVGAMPLDVEQLQPDFLVTVGYKWLLGPFSAGYLYVAEEHRQGEPLEERGQAATLRPASGAPGSPAHLWAVAPAVRRDRRRDAAVTATACCPRRR